MGITRSQTGKTPVEALRLPDHVKPGLRVLFVGINPGVRSAVTGHHFAGHSNRFWRLLHDAGLTSTRLTPAEDVRVLEWQCGLTNLVARPTRGVADLRRADYVTGRRRLLPTIRAFRPGIVALVGVTLCRALFPARESSGRGGRSCLGLRAERLADVPVFVLPNPSGRNAHYSYEEMREVFSALGRLAAGRQGAAPRERR